MTAPAMSEADVSVSISAALLVDFANGGVDVGLAGYFAAAWRDELAEHARRGVLLLWGMGSGAFELDHSAVEICGNVLSRRFGRVFRVAVCGRRLILRTGGEIGVDYAPLRGGKGRVAELD